MKKILDTYDKIEEGILVFSLVLNVLLITLQIVMRSIFNSSLSWSEELSRYIFIWQIWMGVSIAYKEKQHINVDLIFSIFKSEEFKRGMEILVDIICLIFNGFLLSEGIKLLISMNARGALSSGMRLPLIYVYAALPVSSFFVMIRLIVNIVEQIKYKEA